MMQILQLILTGEEIGLLILTRLEELEVLQELLFGMEILLKMILVVGMVMQIKYNLQEDI